MLVTLNMNAGDAVYGEKKVAVEVDGVKKEYRQVRCFAFPSFCTPTVTTMPSVLMAWDRFHRWNIFLLPFAFVVRVRLTVLLLEF
jgi:hypothetical protein